MTRKHFQAIADAIKSIQDTGARHTAAEALAPVCKQFNPNFKPDRFFAACNVGANTVVYGKGARV